MLNLLLLSISSINNDFTIPIWLTYKQAKILKGSVKRGEKGTPIVFFDVRQIEPKTEAEEENPRTYRLLKFYTVFNIEQTDLDINYYKSMLPDIHQKNDKIENIEEFVARINPEIKLATGRAAYRESDDVIYIPDIDQFKSANDYYSTLFHELTHFTKHPSRLNRVVDHDDIRQVAVEELIAELGSAMLCLQFGFTGDLQHPEYIDSWVKVLKYDYSEIFRASTKAKKAYEFLLDYK